MSVLIGTSLDDTLAGDADSDNTIFGDPADSEFPPGNDHLTGGSNSTNLLSGDAEHFRGGGPNITGGGADVLIGGESSTNRMFGDASGSLLAARGGDDVLTGGNDSVNIMSGDAGGNLEFEISRGIVPSAGGNDTLVGGEGSANTLFGDAAGTISASLGGDDTLVAGDGGTNTLIGDALVLADESFGSFSTGGDDLLVSGTGTDDMWGDGKQLLGDSIGGADVFRFLADSGNDVIHDFERGKDLIDVTAISTATAAARSAGSLSASAALGRADLGSLVIEEIDADGDGKIDSVIHLGGENSVTVLGVIGLSDTDFVVTPSSYVLFSRTSTGDGHRDEWVGSEANSHPSATPGSIVPASTFNADLATGPGTVLAGGGAADYAADGILQNANLAMFNLTEAPPGTFATDAPADLAARIVAGTPFFGTANTDLDPTQSDIDLAAGKLHLAQTDADRDGTRNLEISLDSATSFRDIRLENFVDARLKLGAFLPHSDQPPGERFEVQLLGAERGEVDASEAPQAMDLLLAPRTNDGTFQNSFDIKGSLFDDTVTIEAGDVSGSVLGQAAGGIENTIVGENSIPTGGTGGNDTLTGGGNSSNSIFGDALGDLVAATGGNDIVTGGANSTNVMSGDAQGSLVTTFGGNDNLTGGANSTNVMAGDAGVHLLAIDNQGTGGGGDDALIGGANSTNIMYGDAGGTGIGGTGGKFGATVRGGNDAITGGDNSANTIIGDFRSQTGAGADGDDVLIGGANSTNTIIGDVEENVGGPELVIAGRDTLIGGADSTNVLCGDGGGDLNAFPFTGGGHDDTITGGANSINTMFGDTRGSVNGGGSDLLIGGANSTNVMFGDAGGSVSVGRNDTLIAGVGGSNILVGDARESVGQGGDDLLVSATGTDDMWGDSQSAFSVGGHDVFSFAGDNGDDIIHDFERGTDLIELTARFLLPATVGMGARLAAFAAPAQSDLGSLRIEERDTDGDGTTDSIIHLDVENSVTVLGVTGLTSEDIIPASSSYVLFARTSLPQGTRATWGGSEANSQPSDTPGSSVTRAAFDADTATGAGTVLAGPAAADYAADGILNNANVAMFDLTEAPRGVFEIDGAADLQSRIAAGTPLFATATTDLDPVHSEIDLAAGRLHLAQTDRDWNGIKNLEISLDSNTSLRDIRLENFVDTRLKLGDVPPPPWSSPQLALFDVHVLGAKRGEIDASVAPQGMALELSVWTNSGEFQNSFDIKGSIFGDSVEVRPGDVTGSGFGQSESWYQRSENPVGIFYVGEFTTVSANLGTNDDRFNSVAEFETTGANVQFRTTDHVWGGTGRDTIHAGSGDDKLFGDQGSGAWRNDDPLTLPFMTGIEDSDELWGGPGADWLEGNGERGGVIFETEDGEPFGKPISINIRIADRIDCGLGDGARDVVNFNFGDGFDSVTSFEPGTDVLRIAASVFVGTQIPTGQYVIPSNLGPGLLFLGGNGSVFLVGITTPLSQSTDGDYLLFS